MNKLQTDILAALTTLAPDVPVVRLANAILSTMEDHSAPTILADLTLMLSLVKEFKDKLQGTHPTVQSIIGLLF